MKAQNFWEKFSNRTYLSYFFIFCANVICWLGSFRTITIFSSTDIFTLNIFIFTISTIIIGLIIGKFVDISFNRRKFILTGFCLFILGYIFSFMNLLGYNLIGGDIETILTSLIFGVAFGVSTVSVGAYFGDISPPKERGKLQGLSYCICFVISFIVIVVLTPYFFLLSILTITGVCLIIFNLTYSPLSRSESHSEDVEPSSYKNVFGHKNFIYFVISFLLFMIALPLIRIFLESETVPTEFTSIHIYIYYPLLSIFALIGGVWADRGRRTMILVSFLILGLGFAIWGIVDLWGIANLVSTLIIIWILVSIGNAITNVLDYTIPSDYASPYDRGKYIAVFSAASNVGLLISTMLQPYIITLPITTIALIITSLLLFAITPTILTTEPLEEGLSKEVEMKGVYIITQDGRCLVEMSFKDVLIDVDLITSALSAVEGLIRESIHSDKRLQTIDHEDVQILIEYGKYVNSAIIADKETPDLRVRLERFLAAFEKEYHEFLAQWAGDVRPFFEAYKMIDRYFGVYLTKR